MSDKLTTLAELTAAASRDSQARNRLTYLFDEGKFTELDPYAMSGDDLSGVITAFGYVDQNPVYAFSQDISVKKGAMTEAHAKKISKVYSLAAKTGVPVVGIYDSFGADVTDPSSALTAYGYLLSKVANLSGVVPQIAVVAGTCAGCAAMLAESADLTVITKQGELYVAPNADIKDLAENAVKNGTACALCEDDKQACEFAGELIAKLPQNNLSPVPMYEFEEPAFTGADNAQNTVDSIFDADSAAELYAGLGKASYTALATLGGATVGVVATNKTEDKLTSADCSKIARFVRLCDSFAVPVVTFVDTQGFEANDSTEMQGAVKDMTKLASAYAEATTIKLSVVTGKAYGPAFVALAGRGANADLVYACENAVISALDPLTAVEFMQHDQLKGASDLTAKRNELAQQYIKENASAVLAAANGCVDSVISQSAIRRTLLDSIEIMAGKRVTNLPKKHSNIQL